MIAVVRQATRFLEFGEDKGPLGMYQANGSAPSNPGRLSSRLQSAGLGRFPLPWPNMGDAIYSAGPMSFDTFLKGRESRFRKIGGNKTRLVLLTLVRRLSYFALWVT